LINFTVKELGYQDSSLKPGRAQSASSSIEVNWPASTKSYLVMEIEI